MKQYPTELEWLSDPEPYGNLVNCPGCGSPTEINHSDINHEGICLSCGYDIDEACNYHTMLLGRCQAKKG